MDINQNVPAVTQLSYFRSLCSGEMNYPLKTLPLPDFRGSPHKTSALNTFWHSALGPVSASPHCMSMGLSRLGLRGWPDLDLPSPEDWGLLKSMSYSMFLGKQHGEQVMRKLDQTLCKLIVWLYLWGLWDEIFALCHKSGLPWSVAESKL